MSTWIVTDIPALANRLRQIVTKWEHSCSPETMVRLDAAPRALSVVTTHVELILVSLAPLPERGLAVIRQLRTLSKAPIIVVGPRDPTLILDAMHVGADDYVDEAAGIEVELGTALQRQSSQRTNHVPLGRLIAITAAGGGNGRSLIAVNLAVLLAKTLGRCCLIDLDPLGGVCASLLNLTPRHTILDLAQQPEKLDRNTLEQSLVEHDSGVRLLAGANDFVPTDLFNATFLERLVAEARSLFPAVLLDLHNITDEVLLRRLQSSNLTLSIVTRLDFNSICYTGRALEYWERMGISRKSVQLVVNRCGQANEVPLKKLEQVLSLRIKHKLPEAPALVNQSINTGVPLVNEEPESPLSKSLSTLAADLIGESHSSETAAAHPVAGVLSPLVRFGSYLTRLT